MDIVGWIAGAILLFLIFCYGEGNSNNKRKRGELRIARDQSGMWYVYEAESGRVVYEGTKQECVRYVKDAVG